ncbi:uncharacterized protein LOC117590662 [Drosophila guanche]|uniref:Uncharacterized protein n=1 Tax=Drosophila guanche TaxID=7266 RepID=A0A3B0JWI1_DROGU|nr:uncharacterized protein LOC117590662 [Drosophila guanche]SPP75438.1 Hypothetical predicted protein [Drosophila guanche]
MESKSSVLAIGDETSEPTESPPCLTHNEYTFKEEFKNHIQKLLLPDAPQLATRADDDKIEKFCATVMTKNGKQYYEFGRDESRHGHIISGPTLDPKGVTLLVKNRLSKEHWVNETVIESKMQWREVQEIVSDCLDEQNHKIYHYLCYLQENRK